MVIIEHTPSQEEILDFIDDGIRQIHASGAEAKYILIGRDAYHTFRHAMAERLNRKPKHFETYQYLPIVLDPFRTDGVCVVPGPGECAKGVQTYRIEE